MSEHPYVYDMAYGVCIIIFPNPTMMTTGQWDFYICCAVVLLSRLRILGRGRFDSRTGFQVPTSSNASFDRKGARIQIDIS